MESAYNGRKILIGIIIFLLSINFLSIVIISSIYAANGMINDVIIEIIQGIVRTILECLILSFLYKGHKWAKWVLVSLLFIAGFFSLVSFLASYSFAVLSLGLVYIAIGIVLTISKSVNLFLRVQKNGQNLNSNDDV